MTPEQLANALEPLKVVDAKALDEIATALKNSNNKQKRAVGVFLDRINRYRLAPTSKAPKASTHHVETGLKDLSE